MGQDNLELRSPLEQQPTDERLKLWSTFLRVSPSYHVARKLQLGEITRDQAEQLVPDIDRVAAVMRDFGDVWSLNAQQFWEEKSYTLFGVNLSAPNLKVLHVMQEGAEIDETELFSAVSEFARYTRKEMGDPFTVVLSVPIDMNRAELINLFGGMITYFKNMRQDHERPDRPEPKYQLHHSRRQLKVLQQELKAINHRIERSNLSVWQLAIDLGISPYYGDLLNNDKSDKADVFVAKNTLTATMGRTLKYALLVSENAARGIFPSIDPNPNYISKLDFHSMKTELAQMQSVASQSW